MNQLRIGALLSYITISVNMLVALLYTPYMLKMLGQSEYGVYSLVASIIAYLTVLDLGFANAIIRYTAKFKAEGKISEQYEMFGIFFRLYSFIGLFALGVGLFIFWNVDSLFGESMSLEELSTVRILMILMSFNLAFTFPLSIFGAIITAYQNFIFQKIVNLIRVVLNPIVMVLFLFFGYKAIAMVVITTFFNLSTLLINAFYCFYKLRIKLYFKKIRWEFLKEIVIYSIWIFFNMLMNRVYWSLGQFILGVYQGAESVAIYAVSIQIMTMFFAFSSAISTLFLPKLSAMVSQGASDNQISEIFIKTGRIQFAIICFLLSWFVLFGRDFVILWAGDNYAPAYVITLILILPMSIPLIQNIGITILQARNRMKFPSLVFFGISILCICLSIPFTQKWGGVGCATATSLALIVGNIVILNIYYSLKHGMNIPLFWKNIFHMAIAPSILVIAVSFLRGYLVINSIITLLIYAVIYTLIYLLVFFIFSMNQWERSLITSPLYFLYQKFFKNK